MIDENFLNGAFGFGVFLGVVIFFSCLGYGCQKQNQRQSMAECFSKIQREECFK